jgi:ABC-2 type transport system ATP-binding protein
VTPPVLSARQVCRRFGDRVAVDGVDVTVAPGQVVSILGPNGAGKTTTIRMCATLLSPTAGSITVDGIDAIRDPRAARRRTGLVLGGDAGFYLRASARRNLLFFADIAGIRRADRHTEVETALEAVQLTERSNDPVRAFSRGMRQRLHLARALLGRPPLLLLDEPTSGLDPQVAASVRGLIRDLADVSGAAILFSSHQLSEVEQLADHIQVIDHGRELGRGSVREIAALSGVSHVTTFSTQLAVHADGADIGERDGRWHVRVPWRSEPDRQSVLEWLRRHGVDESPVDLVTRPATLEESYLALIGNDAR